MEGKRGNIAALVLIFCLASVALVSARGSGIYGDVPDYGKNSYLSPDFVEESEGILYFTCRTSDELRAYSLSDKKVAFAAKLPSRPSGLAVGKDAVYVSTADPDGKILKISKLDGKILASVPAGHMPRGVKLSKDGKVLFFANQFKNEVRSFDAEKLSEISSAKAVRDPFALAPFKNGVVVVNQLPAAKGGLYEENIASEVNIFECRDGKFGKVYSVALPNGSINCKDVALSPDEKYAYCTHSVARFNVPTTQVERGWINTNAVSVIDVDSKSLLATFLLDDIERGAANPYGIAVSKDGKFLVVSHAGTHEVSVIDLPGLHGKIDDTFARARENSEVFDEKVAGAVRESICNDMSFLHGIRTRIPLKGLGPRHVFASKNEAYVADYYSDHLESISLSAAPYFKTRKIVVGGNEEMCEVRLGDLYFHDASLCFQEWLSCVTCHTETRSDALNWDLLNDGIGNPKQSKSMLFAHYTPPCMITGIRKDAELAVRKGIRYIQFATRSEEDARAIDAYLKSLKPIPSPKLVGGKLSELAQVGQIIFESVGCADCHSGEYFTDMKKHDVGSGLNEYVGKPFDTPTLIESWRTAPYLYDGRARTVFEMLRKHNLGDKHGRTKDLSDDDIRAIEEYVLSL